MSGSAAGPTSFARRTPRPSRSSAITLYALILFAVPTMGVSALVALIAVMTRRPPEDRLEASHFRFQKRTLLGGAGAAVAGGLLIVIGLGVFVLFLAALWMLVRGAYGVLRLKADQPIDNPNTLLI